MSTKIEISVTAKTTLEKAWEGFTQDSAIVKWNFASEDWCCPKATNDLREGGNFLWRMEAKDGSMGFDFVGTFKRIDPLRFISYEIEDGRLVEIIFEEEGDHVKITEVFEAENQHPIELQRQGWQSILTNYKRFIEEN